MNITVSILLCLEALFAGLLLYRATLIRSLKEALVPALLLAGAFLLRGMMFDYETLDYQNFLTRWVDFFRSNGGFQALDTPVGNYNIPYLYFMAAFSYSSLKDLYLIKLLSVFFDVLLAYSAAQLLGKLGCSRERRLLGFFAVLYWPTVLLNGALWGQCDSIYVALALLGLCQALDDRPWLSVMSIALSFGFKLQAVFIMPVYAVLLFAGKLRWKHALAFPLTYVLLVLPAVLLGRPFADTLTLYLGQTGSIGSGLNYNSPSVFAFFRNIQNTDLAAKLSILAAFAFMLGVLLFCLVDRRRLSNRAIVAAAVLLSVGIPFLLPHMHDRYFFAADILTLIAGIAVPLFLPAAVITEFASLLGYHAYLKMRYLLTMNYGAAGLTAVLLAAFFLLKRSLIHGDKKQDEKKSNFLE